MSTGERIKERRLLLNLSQSQLASRLETESSVISRWEGDKVCVSQKYILKLAQALNTSADYLLGKTDDPVSSSEVTVPAKVLVSSEPPATAGRLIYEYGDQRLDLPDTKENRELFGRLVEKIIADFAVKA